MGFNNIRLSDEGSGGTAVSMRRRTKAAREESAFAHQFVT